jgi:hypothetical protein
MAGFNDDKCIKIIFPAIFWEIEVRLSRFRAARPDRIRNSHKESEDVRGAVFLRKTALLRINSLYTNS